MVQPRPQIGAGGARSAPNKPQKASRTPPARRLAEPHPQTATSEPKKGQKGLRQASIPSKGRPKGHRTSYYRTCLPPVVTQWVTIGGGECITRTAPRVLTGSPVPISPGRRGRSRTKPDHTPGRGCRAQLIRSSAPRGLYRVPVMEPDLAWGQ